MIWLNFLQEHDVFERMKQIMTSQNVSIPAWYGDGTFKVAFGERDHTTFMDIVVEGTVTVDWGDGVVQSLTASDFPVAYMFETEGAHTVTVQGTVSAVSMSAFAGQGITSVCLPPSLERAYDGCFSGCTSLTRVAITGSTALDAAVFNACSAIRHITVLATEPPACDTAAFAGVPATATLYVPAGCASAYAADPGWSMFPGLIEETG